MSDLNRKRLLHFLVILLCAGAIKYYYSTSSVNDLRWILAPTTAAVETVTGTRFQFESQAGYINDEKTFLIAASCSGVNFLVAAFLLLAIGRLWRNPYREPKWRGLLFAGVIAYFTTIIANTVRISTALRLMEVPAETGLFTDAQVHRIEGITIYFGFLMLLYLLSVKTNPERIHHRRSSPSPVRDLMLPLLIYYATTLGVPILNGAYSQGAVFWEHVIFVLFTPALLLLPFMVLILVTNRSNGHSLRTF